jgi:hypothetical protein
MRRFSMIMAVLCVAVALATLTLVRNRTAIPASGASVPVYLEVGESVVADAPPSAPAESPRWFREPPDVERSEHRPSTKADWIQEPTSWKLLPLSAFDHIPESVRAALQERDCVIPQWNSSDPNALPHNVLVGEFEQPGQQDVIVLCAHRDETSATYIFWGSDAARIEVAPWQGSSVSVESREAVDRRLDTTRRLEPGTPEHPEHDGLEIGCCECCSTIYYRHRGQWLALDGAD